MVEHEFYEPDSSYNQHVEQYWKKILETPKDENPVTDRTGEKHDVTTNPVFLASSFIGNVTRKLSVSRDKSFFIAVNPVEVCERELDPGENENDLKKHASEDEDSATTAKLTIDNVDYDLKDKKYRIREGLFQVEIPENALEGLEPAGRCKVAADGYYVKIKPLSPGTHTIKIVGEVDHPHKEERPWKQDVTYILDVN
jgi:hypothetical protein